MSEGVLLFEPAGKYVKQVMKINRILAMDKSPFQELLFEFY